ncbi:MAG: hypothetical protein Tsb002_07260 [Wenzhouxiangellaceae bacterium]
MLNKKVLFPLMLALASASVNAQHEKSQIASPKEGSGIVVNLGATNLIQDPSFEAGTPNPSWNEASTNFGTPLCDAAGCGDGGGTAGPNNGLFWAWMGGTAATNEVASVDQDVVIPSGTATLSFFVWNGTAVAGGPDSLLVNVDGNTVLTLAEDDACCTAGYAEVTVDVSAFADGGTHNIEFLISETDGTTTNINLDDVSLIVEAGPMVPPPAEVPVLNQVGLAILLAALALFGMIALRRRQSA